MAKDTRQRTTWGNRFRFLIRFLGLSGLMCAAAGVMLASTTYAVPATWDDAYQTAHTAIEGQSGKFAQLTAILLVGGLAFAVVALVVELLGVLFLATGRRTAANTSATIGAAAAIALLVFVNLYSFSHYKRFDLTRDRHFTLPPAVADELRKLRPESPTTIVVFQQHKTFGTLSGKPDGYDYAAERKVVEKVKDLVDQFREFGPRFNVVVLDVEEEGYERQLADLTKTAPELKAAIEAAPENSIFFHANKRVQRLGFNEFLQLDKTSSKAANNSRGNLVLLPQGVESFARRILAVQEKRPKVAVCVVHEWLTTDATEGQEEYSLSGLKKALTNYGFDVIDIVMKKNWENDGKELEPAAYTKEESKLERLEAELAEADDRVKDARDDLEALTELKGVLDKIAVRPWRDRATFYIEVQRVAQAKAWLELYAVYRKWAAAGGTLTEKNEPEFRTDFVAGVEAQRKRVEQQVAELEKERRAAEDRVTAARTDERTIENAKITDVKVKFPRLLADVDLIIVPRFTVVNATIGSGVSPTLHTLSKEQANVIRDFMKSGKPVMACLGPISGRNGLQAAASDDFERLLAERGVELGRQTILYDGEAKAFSARRAGSQLGGGGPADIPPLVIDDKLGELALKPNPIGAAMKVTGRAVDAKLDLRLRAPRPVYLAPGWQAKLPFAAEFVATAPEAWNEEKPFPQLRQLPDGSVGVAYMPKYQPATPDDPKKGTRDEERRGPFPIGVAIEGEIPASWFDDEYTREQAAAALLLPLDGGLLAAGLTAAAEKVDRPTGRLVVFGSGNLFTGGDLKPAQEKLLLHATNWLVNRPDRLPTVPEQSWAFPRVEMSDRTLTLWRYGTALGMPLVAIYLGLVAVMIRKMR